MIGVVLVVAIVAACLTFYERAVTLTNVGTYYNGLGAVPETLWRTNKAPMRYRVFVPWLMGLLFPSLRYQRTQVFLSKGIQWTYQGIKGILIFLALWAAYSVIGLIGTLIAAFGMAVMVQFDYWDCYVEVGAVAALINPALHPAIHLVAAIVWGLSKETSWAGIALIPITPLAGIATVTRAVMEKYQGKAELYCKRWAWKPYNWPDLKGLAVGARPMVALSIIISVLTLAAVVMLVLTQWNTPLGKSAPLALLWLGTGWAFGRINEPRIFMPCLIWIGGSL